MPDYTYRCPDCRATVDRRESMLYDGPSPCLECGAEMNRVIIAPAVIWPLGKPSSGQDGVRGADELNTQNFLKGRGYQGRPEGRKRWAT